MSLFRNESLGSDATIDGIKPSKYLVVDINGIAAASASQTCFISNDNYVVTDVKVVFSTASSSGTLQVEKATGTQAVASGTNILTGTVSLAGTANTSLSGTLVTGLTIPVLAAGDRLNIILGGTLTSLANCAVNIYLKRL
jgi:hypothetical protein